MKVVLVDNGSLESAAHAGLRAAAERIGRKAGVPVEAVSWKHSDRIPPEALAGGRAWTLEPWVRAQVAAGERDFLFVPFFISPQGAIGSALRGDLGRLQAETGGFEFAFTAGLHASGVLASSIARRVRATASARGLRRPAVIVVDHGGPSRDSALVRDGVAAGARAELGESVGSLVAASMESPEGPGFGFNRPLLAEALDGQRPGDVVIAPLFLLPGRHAGPGGDLERIALGAQARSPTLRCHFTELVGSDPAAVDALAASVARSLAVEAIP